jgi:hypothetical protein
VGAIQACRGLKTDLTKIDGFYLQNAPKVNLKSRADIMIHTISEVDAYIYCPWAVAGTYNLRVWLENRASKVPGRSAVLQHIFLHSR